jgi:hypothetical protein
MNRRNNSVESNVETTSARPKRVPVGMRPRLAVYGKDPAFEYRWVNDTPGNVVLMKQHGWTVCTNEEVDTGNFRAEQASEVGSLAYAIVDGGTGMKAYVMKISKEEYAEIQQAYADEANAREETLQPNYNDGEYGSVKIDRSGRR